MDKHTAKPLRIPKRNGCCKCGKPINLYLGSNFSTTLHCTTPFDSLHRVVVFVDCGDDIKLMCAECFSEKWDQLWENNK